MRRLIIATIAVMLSAMPARSAEREKLSVQSLPPVVVKTVPESGDTKVDASVTEIKVTFSKKMADKSWSWVGDIDAWTNGKPHYEADGKTCVMPVKLEPGKTYVVWLNSDRFGNFRDAKGRSAVPYLLVFETAK